jgi:hypothetical protein
MLKIVLSSLILFTTLSSKAQLLKIVEIDKIPEAPKLPDSLLAYYKYSNEAKFLLFHDKYSEAISLYKKAFNFHKPQATHLEDLVDCYLGLNQKDSADYYAYFCISNFGLNIQRLYKDGITESYYEQDFFKDALGKFYAKEDRIRTIIMLEHYLHNDHFFRSEFNQFNLFDKYNVTNISDFTFKVALQYDSIYAIPFILGVLNKYDFPDAYDIGSNSVRHLLFLLRHYNIDKTFYNLALVSGKMLPEDYASLVDYKFNIDWSALIDKGKLKPQNNYGPNLRKVNDYFIMGEIDDIENLDTRRAAIGLMPLWQYALYQNFKLSEEYTKVLINNHVKFQTP